MKKDSRSCNAFDPSRLIDIFDDDATAIREVIDETIVLMRDILAKLMAETGDGRLRCTALIHELKGLSGNVGAEEIHARSQDIEGRLRDRSRDFSLQWFAELNQPYSRFMTSVERYLSSGV